MNKKVLTLCAGFLLAGSLTAIAENTKWVPVTADQLVSGEVYQIMKGDSVLADARNLVGPVNSSTSYNAPIFKDTNANWTEWTLTKAENGFSLKSDSTDANPIYFNGTAFFTDDDNGKTPAVFSLKNDTLVYNNQIVESWGGLYPTNTLIKERAAVVKFLMKATSVEAPIKGSQTIESSNIENKTALYVFNKDGEYVGIKIKEATTKAVSENWEITTVASLDDADNKEAFLWFSNGSSLENALIPGVYLGVDQNTPNAFAVYEGEVPTVSFDGSNNLVQDKKQVVASVYTAAGIPFEQVSGVESADANDIKNGAAFVLVADGKLVNENQELVSSYDAASTQVWTLSVEKVGEVNYAFFKNQDGEYLVVGNQRVYAEVTVAENGVVSFKEGDNFKLKIDGNNYVGLSANGELTSVDVNSGSALQFGLGDIDVNYMTVGQLNERYGNHFELKITYKDEDGEDVEFTDPFDGALIPASRVSYDAGKTSYSAAPKWESTKNGVYLVKSNKEDIIVVDKNPTIYKEGDKHGYDIKTISIKEYIQALRSSDPEERDRYVAQFQFEYEPTTTPNKVSGIAIYAIEGTTRYEVAKVEVRDVPTLAAVEVVGEDRLDNLTITLNATQNVDAKEWLTKVAYYTVTVKNENEKSTPHYGKILGLDETGDAAFVAPTKTNQGKPEGQWAITYDTTNGDYVFQNRENGDKWTIDRDDKFYWVDAEENTFAYIREGWFGTQQIDTLQITPITDFASTDGYVRFTAEDLNANTYNVAMSLLNGTYMYTIENHNDKHRIGLDDEEMTDWRIEMPTVKLLDNTHDMIAMVPDTVTVETPITYYVGAPINNWVTTSLDPEAKLKEFEDYEPNSALKICTYILKNTATDEYLYGKDYTEEAGNAYYVCEESEEKATRIALKEVGDSTVNLIPVYNTYLSNKYKNWEAGTELVEEGTTWADWWRNYQSYAEGLELSGQKIIGGTTANTGILKDVNAYTGNTNDLFVIDNGIAPTYKELAQGDKIAISMIENNDYVVYEQGDFLGINNLKAYPEINPTLYVDSAATTANYAYQYLLTVRENHVDTTEICNVPTHNHPRTVFTEGDFLVVMRDSMDANKDVHNNIYAYEGEPRLAFVSGIHQNDTLYYTNAAGEIIAKSEVGNDEYNFAKFAFKMVNEENNEFVIETGYDYEEVKVIVNGHVVTEKRVVPGYLRWNNYNLVVTPDINQAKHFTLNASELDATANESINANGAVSVTAVDGAVVIKGAAGKNVVIATILGKVVANETINSDNETIAVPAGIAVVSVDGESFKVVVK